MRTVLLRPFRDISRLLCLALLAAAAAMLSTPAAAQFPQPLAQPNINLVTNGTVGAMLVLPDGSVVIGGGFISVNGVARNNIAKRRTDGSLDPDWHPGIDGFVRALATDSAGNIYAGGDFQTVNGVARRHLVKLTPAGDVVAGWDPSPDGMVEAILVNAAGNAFVGGWFQTIGGKARSNLAKLSTSSGVLDPQWNPAPAATAITTLRLSHDGALYVGGQFSSIGGLEHQNLAKLSMSGSGTVDPDWNPSPNSTVKDIAVAPDGSVFVTGDFWQFRRATGEQWFQRNLAKLSGMGSGSIVEGWDPFNFEQVTASRRVAVGPNGWVYVSGGNWPSFADGTSSSVIRVSSVGTGQIDPTWNPRVVGDPYLFVLNGGKLLVGGDLSKAAGQVRLGFVALVANADAESAFDVEAPGRVAFSMATQPDGRVIVSGMFAKANGQLRGGLLRLSADGSLDAGWDPSPDGVVRAIAFTTDGAAIVGGNFSRIGGQSAGSIAKLSSVDGTADPNWRPDLGGSVRALISDNAGFIYVGGLFTHGTGSTPQRNLVRVGGAGIGAIDATWRPDPNAEVEELSLDGQGALFVRGSFLTVNGESRKRIAKLFTAGPTVLDLIWNPQPSTQMHQIVADGLGSVFVAGGGFPVAGGTWTGSIAKLSASSVGEADPLWKPLTGRLARRIAVDAAHSSLFAVSSTYDGTTGIETYYLTKHPTIGDGAADPNWNPTVNDGVASIQVTAGKVLLGGWFSQVGTQARYGLAALPLTAPDAVFANGFEAAPSP